MHLIGWEQICQWKSLTKCLMKCPPGRCHLYLVQKVIALACTWLYAHSVQRSAATVILSRAPVRQTTLFPLFTCKLMGFFIALREVCAVRWFSYFFVFVCGHKFPDAGRGKIPKWYCPRLLTRKVNTIIETRENTRYIPISVSLALIMRAIPWKKWPAQMSDTGNNDSYFALNLSMHDKWLKKHNENMIYYILH